MISSSTSLDSNGGFFISLEDELETQFEKIPDRLNFKIGDAAEILGVKAYVLRYWESEFDSLKPKKSKNNQRMYSRRDIEALLMVRKLLYKDGFSLAGAKGALRKLKKELINGTEEKAFRVSIKQDLDELFKLIQTAKKSIIY